MSDIYVDQQKLAQQARELAEKFNLKPFELNHIARDELAEKCKIHSSTCESIEKQLEGGFKRDDFICLSAIQNPEGFKSQSLTQTIDAAITQANNESHEPFIFNYDHKLLDYDPLIDVTHEYDKMFADIRKTVSVICADVSCGSRIEPVYVAHNELPKLMGVAIDCLKSRDLVGIASATTMPDMHMINRDHIVLGHTGPGRGFFDIRDQQDALAVMCENKERMIRRGMWDYDGDTMKKQKPIYTPKGSKVLTHGVNAKKVAKNRKKKKSNWRCLREILIHITMKQN